MPRTRRRARRVVVTGIRASIENAIAVRRESGSIVESVSAEDIGKLPDTSIAESISRLPGLTSQRAEGRASAISLRGTDPGFTTALMNGREQVGTGDNRSVEFDQYPSELLSSVVVYKTPDSQLVGPGPRRHDRPAHGPAAAIRPQAIAMNIRGEKNSNDNLGADSDETDIAPASPSSASSWTADSASPSAMRTSIRRWRPGVSAPTSHGILRAAAARATAGGTRTASDNPGVAPGQYATNGMKVRADMGSTVRDGFMATLQFEPNDFYSGIIDLYYSTMDQTNNARSLEVNLGGYPAPCCPVRSRTVRFRRLRHDDREQHGRRRHAENVAPLARNFLFTTEDESWRPAGATSSG